MQHDDADDRAVAGPAPRAAAAEGADRALTPGLIRVLARVLDAIPAMINVKDSERRYIYVNRFLFEYYGDQPDAVLGRRAEEIMPPERAEGVNASDRQVLESGRPTGMWETSDTDLEGRSRRWLMGKWPLLDGAGKVTNVVTAAFDITELHEAREAGAERIRMMQRVTAQAPLILVKTILWPDGSTTIPFVAGQLAEDFGIDREAVARDGSLLTVLIHPEDRAAVIGQWHDAIRRGARYAIEFRAFLPSGEMRWLSANATQRREEDGRIVVDEVIVDITELHAIRHLAEESEQQLRSLAESVPGLIARRVTRPDGSATIPFVSGEFVRRMRIDPSQARVQATLAWQGVHPEDRPGLERAWRKSIESLGPFDHTCRFIDPDDQVIWVRSRTRHRRLDNGDIVSDTLSIDITEEKRAELELQHERELFQSVASHLPGLIFRRTVLGDGTTRYDYIEGALLDRLAIDRSEARRNPAVLWAHFESATEEPAMATIEGSLARLEPYRLLLRCRPADAVADVIVEVTATPRATADGVVVDGIGVDVTARLRAETEAREQRMLLQQVIDAVPAAINVKNSTGRIELANRTLADYYGVTPQDLISEAGQHIQDPPQDEIQTREWDEAVMRSGVVSDAREYAYVDRDGRTRHWLGRKSPLRNPVTGALDRVVTVSLDVTDRVQAEESARQYVALLHSVASSIPGAVLRWRCEGENVIQEFAAGRFVESGDIDGACREGALARIWPGLLREDAATLTSALGSRAGGRGALELELRMRTDEEARWIKLFARHRLGGGGEPAWDIIVLDTTESKQYEEQLRIAQKMDAIGNLTGGIAHDFNNILAVIVANLDLLLDLGLPDGESSEVTHSALRAAERGAELTGRLLAFARNQPAEPRVFDCDVQIDGFASFIRRSLGPEILLDLRRGRDTPLVNVDPGQFENALMNLVVNARDAMDGRGRIVIESAVATLSDDDHMPASLTPGRYTVIAVSDTGAGMTPEVQRRAFEPLFTTKTQGRGTGFGLPMVYNFAKQAGGLVTLYSEPGVGTTARLYLPCAEAPDTAASDTEIEERPLPVAAGNICILLVDDNAEARSALARQLKRQGFQVAEAGDATHALALAEDEDTIDLLITDIIMPGPLNGAELADRLHEERPDLPILLTSGYSSDVLAERSLTRGRYELLGKPFRERELMAAVARLLGHGD